MRPNRYQLDHPRTLNWIPLPPKYRVFLVEMKKSELGARDYLHSSWQAFSRFLYGNPRQSWIMDSTPWIPDSLSVELGFRISIFNGVPKSLSCIPDSKSQDSRFPSLMGFRIPWAEFQISNPRVLESTSKNFRESGISGIWIPLDGEGGGGGGGGGGSSPWQIPVECAASILPRTRTLLYISDQK